MKKLLLLILSVAMIISMLAFVTSCGGDCTEHVDADKDGKCDECGETVEVVCTEHKDEDDDVLCDICGEVYVKPVVKVEVDVAFNIKDQDGAAVPNVQVTLVNVLGGTPVIANGNADGVFTAKLEVGKYNVSFDYNADEIGYYLSDTAQILVGENTTAIDLKMINNNPNGTQSRPYIVYAGEENSFTIPAGGACYYVAYHAVGMLVDVNSTDVKVNYNGAELTADGGVIHFALVAEDTNSAETFEIVNTSGADVSFTVDMYSRPGTHGNPHKLTDVSAPIVSEPINNKGIVYYSYTATESGTVTLTLNTLGASAAIMNTANSITESTDAGNNAITLVVSEGDVIIIDLATSSDDLVEISFTLTITAAE